MRNDVTPSSEKKKSACNICYESFRLEDTETLNELPLEDTKGSLSSSDSLKHKDVLFAVYLLFNHSENNTPREEKCSSEYINTLNRGGLTVLMLAETHFVLCGYQVFNKLIDEKKLCMNYLEELFSLIESPMSTIKTRAIQKAYVLGKCDGTKEITFLCRREITFVCLKTEISIGITCKLYNR